MTEKEKQIEEMREIVSTQRRICHGIECAECDYRGSFGSDCIDERNIAAFYAAGYRKASDVIDDFVERVKERLEEFTKQDYEDGVPYYHADCEQIDNVIDDVADEMRQEVEK